LDRPRLFLWPERIPGGEPRMTSRGAEKMNIGERPCAQARRVRIARPRPARPTASSAIDVGSGTGKGAATSGLNVDDEIPPSEQMVGFWGKQPSGTALYSCG
jgi:hypothetical protein